MTDVTFYDDMVNLATELMNDFGTPATLRKVAKPKPGADGKSIPTHQDHPGLAVRIHDKELIQALGLEGDLGYAMKFPAEAGSDDKLIHAGETYVVQQVKRVNPEGNRLMIAFGTVTLA